MKGDKTHDDRPCQIMFPRLPLHNLNIRALLQFSHKLIERPEYRRMWPHNAVVINNAHPKFSIRIILRRVSPVQADQARLLQPRLLVDDGLGENPETLETG